MKALRSIGYLLAAIAVLTALMFGGFILMITGVILGLLLKVTLATFFTAEAIRSYFEKKP